MCHRLLALLMRTVLVQLLVSACVRIGVSASISVGGGSAVGSGELLMRVRVTVLRALVVSCALGCVSRGRWRGTRLCCGGHVRAAAMAIGARSVFGMRCGCMASAGL